MSVEYNKAKAGKLKLKGEKSSHKKHKSKKRKHGEDGDAAGTSREEDTNKHGGWWKVTSVAEINGSVAIQFGDSPIYVRALNQGLFTVGAPHDEGDGPDPEEILTAVPAGNNRIAFKSGYGKYLSVDNKGRVTGVADAIGTREQWEPVFQDGRNALLAPNDCFIGLDDEDNVIAKNPKAGPEEMISIRCNSERKNEKCDPSVEIDKGKLKKVELNYIKMFQKFQDKKIKVCPEGRAELKEAKGVGRLHEALLDRRSKMKADRYCK